MHTVQLYAYNCSPVPRYRGTALRWTTWAVPVPGMHTGAIPYKSERDQGTCRSKSSTRLGRTSIDEEPYHGPAFSLISPVCGGSEQQNHIWGTYAGCEPCPCISLCRPQHASIHIDKVSQRRLILKSTNRRTRCSPHQFVVVLF